MKTAVEYLEEIIYDDKEFSLSEVFEQAKEMEKEQIKFFFDKGHLYSGCQFGLEECYNETFNKEV